MHVGLSAATLPACRLCSSSRPRTSCHEAGSLILDPRKIRPNGEMDFIKLSYAEEDNRFKDFTSFLRAELKTMNQLVKEERKGKSDDEDDD